MNIIVAVDKNWTIGRQGGLLVSIPDDQKMFREETLGKVVVMGRKTLESLPGGRPLYGRTNIVLTTDQNYQIRGAVVCHSMEEALKELEKYPSDDIFVMGGQSIYEQFLPYCEIAHVTYIDYEYEGDTWFVNLDKDENWKMIVESEEQTYFNLCYTFRMYRRIKGKGVHS
ncbi:dihydrofolate reductase [Lachnospiraceae bacterium 62-35]